MELGLAGSLLETRTSHTFFILLLQRVWLNPRDGSYREANLHLIKGKDSAARAVVNTQFREPAFLTVLSWSFNSPRLDLLIFKMLIRTFSLLHHKLQRWNLIATCESALHCNNDKNNY